MNNQLGSLEVPPEAVADAAAVEMLRAWVANESLHCILHPDVWREPGNWGILLADVARHVANAMEEKCNTPADVTLARIRELFNLELGNPTDDPSGHFGTG